MTANKAALDALEFYSDPRNYAIGAKRHSLEQSAVDRDIGEKARAALALSPAAAAEGHSQPTVHSSISENGMATFACDDDRDTTLRMMQDGQGDVWLSIASNKPEIFKGVRLRTKQGGGADANMGLRHHLAKFLSGLKSDTVIAAAPHAEQGDLDKPVPYTTLVKNCLGGSEKAPEPERVDGLKEAIVKDGEALPCGNCDPNWVTVEMKRLRTLNAAAKILLKQRGE